MPDYNAAVAAGLQPQQPVPQQNFANTLSTVADFQRAQAATQLSQLQALQQQRQYNALLAASQASQQGEDAGSAYMRNGGDPNGLPQIQAFQFNQRFATTHSGQGPQQAEASANIAEKGAEIANQRAQLPGFQAKSDSDIQNGAAQVANQYAANPIPANWQAMVDYTTTHKGKLAAAQLANITDPDERMQRVKGFVGGGLTAEQAKPQVVAPGSNFLSPTDYLAGRGPTSASGAANTPQSVEMQKQTAEKTIDYLQGDGHKSYSNAQAFLGSMQTVDNTLQQLGPAWMGPGSEAKTKFVNGLNTVFNQFGIKPISPDAVGNSELLGKEAKRAGLQFITSQLGQSREAAQTIQTGISSVVNQGNSYVGAKMLSESLKSMAQRQVDLYEYQAANPNQLPAQSEVQFNKSHPPQEYAMKGITNAIPAGEKQFLATHPNQAALFDKHYGPGTSQYLLGQQPQQQ